jgi:hypothetical protein
MYIQFVRVFAVTSLHSTGNGRQRRRGGKPQVRLWAGTSRLAAHAIAMAVEMERAALFDADSDSSDDREEDLKFHVNEDFARRFEVRPLRLSG